MSKMKGDGISVESDGESHRANGSTTSISQSGKTDVGDEVVFEGTTSSSSMLYRVADHPPIHLTIFFGFQQALVALSGAVAISLMVAEVTCANAIDSLKAKLLSSTLLMNGLTTILMNVLGIGLPVYQSAASDFLVPLFAMQIIDYNDCSSTLPTHAKNGNSTYLINGNNSQADDYEFALSNIRQLQGSLIAAGIFQGMLGATGLLGLMLRFVGPNTITPVLLLTGVYMVRAVIKFMEVQWGVGFGVCVLAVIMSLYLSKHNFPVPFWSRKRGCYILWYPLHQVFSILIAMLIGWGLCAILTICGVFTDDPNNIEYKARTDYNVEYIQKAPWIQFPYPGQFGPIDFNVSVFLGFTIASITSIIDSIGDYYACANICGVPPPPRHAINRGITVEGFCSSISGLLGCGHGTTTNGGCLGVLGLTKVASRDVMIVAGIIYLIFGIVGKTSAVFIAIPYPVLGGALIVMFGMFVGVALSSLHVVDLKSTRNLAVLGIAVIVGLLMPFWIEKRKDSISFGSETADEILKMLLANPSLVAGIVACFLDNTIPGTLEERGITAWQKQIQVSPTTQQDMTDDKENIYENILPNIVRRNKYLTKLPFIPPAPKQERTELLDSSTKV